jgi:hypothetical protein
VRENSKEEATMYHYEIHAEDGFIEKGRPSDFAAIRELLIRIKAENIEHLGRYYLKGEEVSFGEILDATNDASDEWFSDRRLISWKEGDCENTRRYKWIRK